MNNWANASERPEHINIYINNFGEVPERFHVHHIDNDHSNNTPENLIAIPRVFHKNIHSNYAFYLSLARAGLINKRLLEDLQKYYESQGYSRQRHFGRTLVEFLMSKTEFNYMVENQTEELELT